MTSEIPAAGDDGPRCDCGYRCVGDTLADLARDGERHALEAHGIVVSPDEVLRDRP